MSLQSGLSLVTLVEMPVPHVFEHWDQEVVCTMHLGFSKARLCGSDPKTGKEKGGLDYVCLLPGFLSVKLSHSFPPISAFAITQISAHSPGSIFRPPFTMAISSLFLVSSPSEASRPNSLLKKPSSSSSASLLSSQTHSSQHCPGTLTSLGLGQPRLGRESSCGQSGMQPTAPSMHVHWCLQLGWKLSPFW